MIRLLIAFGCVYAFMVVCGILVYLFDKLIDWLSNH